MTVSGTVSTTVFNTGAVIDAAFRRCRVPSQEITGEMIQIAKDALYLILSSAPQRGMQLWTVDKQIITFVQGQAAYDMPAGTVDLADKNACNYRTTTSYDGTDAYFFGGISRDFGAGDERAVSTVGVIFSAGGTYELLFKTSDDGITYTQVGSAASATYEADTLYWFDVDPVAEAQYFAIVDSAPAVMSIDTLYTTGNPSEIPMSRQSQYDYLSLPNKTFQGRPIQIWFDRQREVPVIHVWPTPNSAATMAQMVISRKRQIMDVGTMTQTLDIPQRWYDAIVSWLASKLAMECPIVKPEMIPLLDAQAKELIQLAQYEERDNSPMKMLPNIRGYTR